MVSLSILISEVATIPSLDLAHEDFPRDREARMGKGATFQHVEGVERAGDDLLGVLALQDAAPFEPDQQLDDQQPGHEADGRVYGNAVGPGLLRLLRHDATSLHSGELLKRELAADPPTDRQRSRRHSGRGCWRRRELVNVPPAGGRPSLSPAPGGGPSLVGRRHPLRDEFGCEPSDNRSDGLKAFCAPACPAAELITVDALDLVHADDVANCQHRFHPERSGSFPGQMATHVNQAVM